MAISALFSIEGTATPAAVEISYDDTVNLALLSTTGVKSVSWEIIGVSSNLTLASAPSITLSGSPPGITASFVADSDLGDGRGIGYCVQCTVSDGKNTATSTGIVGVVNQASFIPPVANERLARHATLGWLSLLDGIGNPLPTGSATGELLCWNNTSGAWEVPSNIVVGSGFIGLNGATSGSGLDMGGLPIRSVHDFISPATAQTVAASGSPAYVDLEINGATKYTSLYGGFGVPDPLGGSILPHTVIGFRIEWREDTTGATMYTDELQFGVGWREDSNDVYVQAAEVNTAGDGEGAANADVTVVTYGGSGAQYRLTLGAGGEIYLAMMQDASTDRRVMVETFRGSSIRNMI